MSLGEKIIFMDRDGTINKKMPEHEYVSKWSEFEFAEGALQVLKIIKQKGYKTILVTNQQCIAKKLVTKQQLNYIHNRMQRILKDHSCEFDYIFCCPHGSDENCSCRKPKPGLLSRAEEYYLIDKANSFIIGDSDADVQTGLSFGIKTVKIGPPCCYSHYNVKCLSDILDIL